MNGLRVAAATILLSLLVWAQPVGVNAAGGVFCGNTNWWSGGTVEHAGYYNIVLFWNANLMGSCIGFNTNQTNLGNWYRGVDNRSWNDQVSSFDFNTNDCHYRAEFYAGIGYASGPYPPSPVHGGRGSGGFLTGWNDVMSSLKIVLAPTCPG